jgi:hypothetical protein
MSVSRDEETLETPVVDIAFIAFQDLKEEAASLEQQRRHLNDQRALLDFERAELEQQMAALQLHYALLDALSTRLDQQEAMLVSDAEVIRMTGKRLSPRLLKR